MFQITPSSPDDIHALTKNEFSELLSSIKNIEKSFGTGEKLPTESEIKNRQTNRVSIVALTNISKGTKITKDMIDIRRPGSGIQPKFFDKVIGMTTKENILKDEILDWDFLN